MDTMCKPVVHLELHTQDLGAAQTLYRGLCGWRGVDVVTEHGCYRALELGTRLSGGAVECSVPRAMWLPYVEVPEISTATARAIELGARVLLAPREGPAGWRSVISSPAGGELALWQAKDRWR